MAKDNDIFAFVKQRQEESLGLRLVVLDADVPGAYAAGGYHSGGKACCFEGFGEGGHGRSRMPCAGNDEDVWPRGGDYRHGGWRVLETCVLCILLLANGICRAR